MEPIIVYSNPPIHWLDRWGPAALSPALAFFLGMLGAVIVERLKRRFFRPKIAIGSVADSGVRIEEAQVRGTNDTRWPSKYLKAAITNSSVTVATDCRVYLVGLIRIGDDSGAVESILSEEASRLRWAFEGEGEELHEGIDIPKGVKVYFDLFSSKNEAVPGRSNANERQNTRIIQFASSNARSLPTYFNRLSTNNTYQFNVVATCQGCDPVSASIKLHFGNNWNDLTILE